MSPLKRVELGVWKVEMNGYTKLFGSIIASTIWGESDQTRIVWITMLAMADQHGEVQSSIPGLAKFAQVSIPAVESALEKLLSPDQYSRTKDHDGRRIEAIDGGWVILNHAKYRAKATAEEQLAKAAERQRRYRARHANVTDSNGTVTPSNDKQKQIQNQKKETEEEREGIPSPDFSEVPDLKQAIASVATDGIPEEFIKLAHADWTDNGGKNSQGIHKPWTTYVRGRWRYEQVDWRNGTHRANRTHHGSKYEAPKPKVKSYLQEHNERILRQFGEPTK
jgi:hypothetical protein